jgi:hypothetical protein
MKDNNNSVNQERYGEQFQGKWIPAEKDSEYDGVYIGYIEKHETCGAINHYQRTVSNQKNQWLLEGGEKLLYWMPLPPPPKP